MSEFEPAKHPERKFESQPNWRKRCAIIGLTVLSVAGASGYLVKGVQDSIERNSEPIDIEKMVDAIIETEMNGEPGE